MRPSHWSLSVLLIVLGCSLVAFPAQRAQALAPTTFLVSGSLVLAGLALFLRRPFTFWLAIGAGLLAVLMAVVSLVMRRELVPVPWLTLAVGLVVTLRVLLAQSMDRNMRQRMADAAAEQDEEDHPSAAPPPITT